MGASYTRVDSGNLRTGAAARACGLCFPVPRIASARSPGDHPLPPSDVAHEVVVREPPPRLGITIPAQPADTDPPRLYVLLERELGDGAHARYNALRSQLVSFLHAAERRRAHAQR